MCGRFTLTVPTYEMLAESLGVQVAPGFEHAYRPRYNVAPTDPSWILRMYRGVRELASSDWGFIPRWSKTRAQGGRPINARSETAVGRSMFRDSLGRRRCVVVTDGFFEWQKIGKERLPFWFRPPDGDLLLMAGVWDHWFDVEADQRVCSFILTTAANEDVEPLHDRMPVILGRADVPAWLGPADPGEDAEIPPEARALLRPCPKGTLSRTRVSTRVNSVKNDDPSCVSTFIADDAANPVIEPEATPQKPKRRKKSEEATLSLFGDTAGAREGRKSR